MDALAIVILIVYAVVGVIFCFFGNRWIKVIVGIFGFVVGFLIANTLLSSFTSIGGVGEWLISIGAGLVVAVLFIYLIYLGIFFVGFGGGILLSLLLADAFNLNVYEWYIYIPVLVVSSIFGALTLNLRRIFVSVFTSFIGASALAQVIYQISSGDAPQALVLYSNQKVVYAAYTSTIYLVSLAALFCIGLIVQMAITGKKDSAK